VDGKRSFGETEGIEILGYQSFRELRVWQEAKSLAVEIYRLTNSGSVARDFGLRDQMQRAAVSLPSNIAEGYERNSDAEFARFLYITKGSLSELITQLEIAKEVGLIPEESFLLIEARCTKLGAMITKLIQSRK
jgi:four helix bundle protein